MLLRVVPNDLARIKSRRPAAAKVGPTVKAALTRLTILFAASLILCVSSAPGVALAAKTKHHRHHRPTNAAQNQYLEKVPPTISGRKHTRGATKRHGSTGTTRTGPSTTRSTGAGTTPSKHVHKDGTATVGHHHKTKSRKTKHHRIKRSRTSTAAQTRLADERSSQHRTHGTAGLNTAAATGSGGGVSVWLLVILALVLVSASAAGILRYRRNR